MFLKKELKNLEELTKNKKNYCSRLYKMERKKFFNNLNPSFVIDNKIKSLNHSNTIKLFFLTKIIMIPILNLLKVTKF